MGLSPSEAWSLTPGQIAALSKRRQWDNFFEDRRAGIIAATIANVHRGKGKSYAPEDFMPKYNLISEETAQTAEQMLLIFDSIADLQNKREKNG